MGSSPSSTSSSSTGVPAEPASFTSPLESIRDILPPLPGSPDGSSSARSSRDLFTLAASPSLGTAGAPPPEAVLDSVGGVTVCFFFSTSGRGVDGGRGGALGLKGVLLEVVEVLEEGRGGGGRGLGVLPLPLPLLVLSSVRGLLPVVGGVGLGVVGGGGLGFELLLPPLVPVEEGRGGGGRGLFARPFDDEGRGGGGRGLFG